MISPREYEPAARPGPDEPAWKHLAYLKQHLPALHKALTNENDTDIAAQLSLYTREERLDMIAYLLRVDRKPGETDQEFAERLRAIVESRGGSFNWPP